jgi:hypothetical protein
MALTQRINVELKRKQLIDVKFYVLDKGSGFRAFLTGLNDVNIDDPQNDEALVYEDGYWVNKPAVATIDPAQFVQGEVPTPIPPVLSTAKFTTVNNYESGTLEIFLNGMKLLPSDLTLFPPNQFSISTLDTILGDVVTVNYIKQ